MVARQDLEKLGWRITDEGLDYLLSEWDDESDPNPHVNMFFHLSRKHKNLVIYPVVVKIYLFNPCI